MERASIRASIEAEFVLAVNLDHRPEWPRLTVDLPEVRQAATACEGSQNICTILHNSAQNPRGSTRMAWAALYLTSAALESLPSMPTQAMCMSVAAAVGILVMCGIKVLNNYVLIMCRARMFAAW